jgi:hypothetical protein
MPNSSIYGYHGAGTAWRPVAVDAQGRLTLAGEIQAEISDLSIVGGTIDQVTLIGGVGGVVTVAGTVTAVGGDGGGTVAISGGTVEVSSLPAIAGTVEVSAVGGVVATAGTVTASGISRLPQATLTRPADTTTYAAGDEISSSTSAPVALAFAGLGDSGVLTGATMWQSANQTTALSAELWLFRGTAAPTPNNDNAAFAPGTADLARVIGVIPFSTSYNGAGTAGSGTAGNRVWVAAGMAPMPYETSGGTLWGRVVARNAYVPVSAEVFGFTLRALQDEE